MKSNLNNTCLASDLIPSIRSEVNLPVSLKDGTIVSAKIYSFNNLRDKGEHFAVAFDRTAIEEHSTLIRIHSECITGDVLGSARCDCGSQLAEAMLQIAAHGGYLIYLRQEGRGIGLYKKLDAYLLQEGGIDTYEANRAIGRKDDERDYGVAADILAALNLRSISLITNNPDKASQLSRSGVVVEKLIPTGVFETPYNRRYLESKVKHTHHTIALEPSAKQGRNFQGVEND
jgi:GTP cyclohydrolase II